MNLKNQTQNNIVFFFNEEDTLLEEVDDDEEEAYQDEYDDQVAHFGGPPVIDDIEMAARDGKKKLLKTQKIEFSKKVVFSEGGPTTTSIGKSSKNKDNVSDNGSQAPTISV